MIFPTDAFELIRARPEISGGAVPSSVPGGRFYPPVRMEYDIPESDWPKHGLPLIVWKPGRDRFDAGQRQKSVVVGYEGQQVTLEPIGRCQAGHDVHFFVARTSDLQCRRELYKLVSRFIVAARYAMQTSANYSIEQGEHDSDGDRRKYPNALHYVLEFTPYIPVLDEPGALSTVDSIVVTATSIAG